MDNIKIIRVFNLVNPKGTKLQLRLGAMQNCANLRGKDMGWRWSFIGTEIPMPVRNGTWFNGFPEATMMNWLMDQGWMPESAVEMATSRVRVFNLPKGNEDPDPAPVKHNHYASLRDSALYKNAFNEAIRHLVDNGKRITAVRVYRYVHGGSLVESNEAVKEICAN